MVGKINPENSDYSVGNFLTIKKATPEGVAFDNLLFKLLLFSLILLQINFKLFFLNIDILFNKVINVDIMLNKSFQIG